MKIVGACSSECLKEFKWNQLQRAKALPWHLGQLQSACLVLVTFLKLKRRSFVPENWFVSQYVQVLMRLQEPSNLEVLMTQCVMFSLMLHFLPKTFKPISYHYYILAFMLNALQRRANFSQGNLCGAQQQKCFGKLSEPTPMGRSEHKAWALCIPGCQTITSNQHQPWLFWLFKNFERLCWSNTWKDRPNMVTWQPWQWSNGSHTEKDISFRGHHFRHFLLKISLTWMITNTNVCLWFEADNSWKKPHLSHAGASSAALPMAQCWQLCSFARCAPKKLPH